MSSPRRNVLGVLALLLLCSVLGWRVLHRQVAGRELTRLLAADPTPPAAAPAVSPAPAPKWVATATLPAGAKPKFTDAKFTHRLRNTAASADELNRNERALLLRNAFVDTASGEPLAIPAALRSDAPGAYIVQAQGAIGE